MKSINEFLSEFDRMLFYFDNFERKIIETFE